MADDTVIRIDHAQSVAGRPLPPPPTNGGGASIVLFYQYKEHPVWTATEHKHVLRRMVQLGETQGITGRGRIAPEGVNCTLTADCPHAIRAFCQALRDTFPAVFGATDFKITDGIPVSKVFRSLSLRKTTELVAYGLDDATGTAPSIQQFGGDHLTADRYHTALAQPDTVVIDVRNRYETQLGHLAPPPGGATLLDPQLRHSKEFPAWLQNVQPQLENKTVLMYCTGGIRCERATALLNQMSIANRTESSSKTPAAAPPKAVYELQGGIERYLQTFPEGGYWKGKNYLFDKRLEQVPAQKSLEEVEAEMDTTCCVCHQRWTQYRGQFTCDTCAVPVIVCTACANESTKQVQMICELCQKGYRAPNPETVDLVGMKRKAEAGLLQQQQPKQKEPKTTHQSTTDRLFLSRLPLMVSKTKLAAALDCSIVHLQWITDPSTGAFYGSCRVQTDRAVATGTNGRIAGCKRPFKIQPLRDDSTQSWPPSVTNDSELPPLGSFLTGVVKKKKGE